MSHFIITISRQYGSGGAQIGKSVAELLGIPYYERAHLDKIAHERGEDKGYIPKWREDSSSSEIWGADDPSPWKFSMSSSKAHPYYSNEQEMFSVQSRIIRELAEKQSCVFVGRCADYILKDYPQCLRVLICASEDSRVLRIYNEYYDRSGSLAHKMDCIDKGRAAYYKRCTGRTWGQVQYYQMYLDSGALGIDGCVETLAAAAQKF